MEGGEMMIFGVWRKILNFKFKAALFRKLLLGV